MKKLLFIVLTCFFSFQGFAQDPAIYQTWYLNAYNPVPDHNWVSEITPHINPMMVITSNLDFSGEAACNTFNGNFVYDDANDQLIVNTISPTTNDCAIQDHTDFESYFFSIMSNDNVLQYTLAGENTNLRFVDSNGKSLTFRNTPIQNPDFSQTWYATDIYYEESSDNINVSNVNPPISPNLTVDGINFSGQAACNTYSGTFSFVGSGVYFVNTFTKTDNECEYQSHTEFEEHYFNQINEGFHFDPLTGEGPFGFQYLDLANPLFTGIKYSNIPFPVPGLINNWHLWGINYDSGDVLDISTIDPPIAPNLSIYPNLDIEGFGNCNSFEGNFEYDAVNETLTTLNYSETIEDCEGDSIEADYFAFFSSGEALIYSINPFDPNELIISSPSFNYDLVFNKNPILSNPSFDKVNMVIYPNPVSDQLYISSENIVIEAVTIYSLNGKKVGEEFDTTNSIDVSALSKGMYFIVISSESGKSIKKFIKK